MTAPDLDQAPAHCDSDCPLREEARRLYPHLGQGSTRSIHHLALHMMRDGRARRAADAIHTKETP